MPRQLARRAGQRQRRLGAPKHACFDEHASPRRCRVRVGGGDAAARARQLSSGRGHDGRGKGPALGKNRVRKRDGRRGGVFFSCLWSCWKRLHCSTCRPRRRWHASTLNGPEKISTTLTRLRPRRLRPRDFAADSGAPLGSSHSRTDPGRLERRAGTEMPRRRPQTPVSWSKAVHAPPVAPGTYRDVPRAVGDDKRGPGNFVALVRGSDRDRSQSSTGGRSKTFTSGYRASRGLQRTEKNTSNGLLNTYETLTFCEKTLHVFGDHLHVNVQSPGVLASVPAGQDESPRIPAGPLYRAAGG